MVSKKLKGFYVKEAKEFVNHVIEEKPLLPFLIPLGFFAWAIERWLVPLSNWVPLAFAVWATIQYGNFQRQLLLENMNKRWKQLILNTSPVTPLEPCEWLNIMMLEVWPNYLEPRISGRLSSVVERKMKHRKPKLIEKIEMQEFSLGSCPPNLGKNGMRWYTSSDQKVLQLGFDWDTNEMSIMLLAKLAKPLKGTARIVINQIHFKGDVLLIPVLDGQAILYSFESTPEVRIGVAFGSGTQTLPATELPGVSTWLVKLLTETIVKTMVEPRRMCYPLQSVKTVKTAVGGILSITMISADNLCPNDTNTSTMETRQSSKASNQSFGSSGSHIMQTFIEVELGSLRRRTNFSQGRNPRWDTTYNLVLLGNSETIKFNLYERNQNSVKLNHLTSCEIKIKYVADDSTIFWAIGEDNGVLIKHAECGKAVEMAVPFEEAGYGELSVRLDLKEWHYADDSASSRSPMGNQTVPSAYSSSNIQLTTGRKLMVTVVEGKDLVDISGKCDPYVRLHYGKSVYRTKTISQTSNPVWNQLFVFDELEDGDYLRIKCYSADAFGDENIGTAHVNMEGIHEGDCRDVWVPLEKVSSGELRLQIEAVKSDDYEEYKNSIPRGGIVELVIIEARDLVADMRGLCDPFVRVQYGNTKKNTKVIRKTLNPQWNQTLEFPDTGNRLILNVKDHNSLLPTYNIGNCIVEYERLPPNQSVDKWIPLQGVKSGEIHIRVTKRVPELQTKSSTYNHNMPSVSDGHKISEKIREVLSRIHGLIEDGDFEGLILALSEVESAEDVQEKYIIQLEKERDVLIDKICSIGHEIHRTSSSPQ